MIKKLFLIIIVGMLVFSGVQAINISKSEEIINITQKVTFLQQPITEEKDSYLSLRLEGEEADRGRPPLQLLAHGLYLVIAAGR